MNKSLILASGSSIRQQMLQNAGIEFHTEVARIDEGSVKASLLAAGANPVDVADRLAEMKALRISGKNPGAIVIGSDQVLEFDGQILSKPKDLPAARTQLCQLRGKTHKLLSAAVIAKDSTVTWRHVGKVRLKMRDFSDEYLTDYLGRLGSDALNTVGSYKLEAEGIRLFERIDGDYFTVLGMPLLEILNHLTTIGAINK